MGVRNPLLLRIETAPTDSVSSSYRPDAQVSTLPGEGIELTAEQKLSVLREVPPLDVFPRQRFQQAGLPAIVQASISLQSYTGDFKLVSNSFQEYKFTDQGLLKSGRKQAKSEGTFYQISEKDIDILERLGEGASSTVHRAWWRSACTHVAIKSINCMEKEKCKQIMNDIRGLGDVSHPRLVQFYGAYRVPDSGQISLVLEYLDCGSLADLTKQVGKVPERILASVSAQILQGFLYLHRSRHTVHRDIKPANILLNSSGQVKIADFGISASVDNTFAVCNTFLGTVTYMSPERINSQPYSFAADIWGLGLTLLECVTGRYPFDATAGPLVLMMQVLKEKIPMPSRSSITADLYNFLERCLCKDPFQRGHAEELLQHPFVTQSQNPQQTLADYLLSRSSQATASEQVNKPTMGRPFSSSLVQGIPTAEAVQLIERHFSSLSAGVRCKQDFEDLASDVVMTHEGVQSRGKSAVLRKLASIYELQLALGANKMTVDSLQMQVQHAFAVFVLACGHMDVTNAGPLGSALLGNVQSCQFASTFELVKQSSGRLAISKLMFRHL